jgi:hypothetical protein
MLKTICLLLKKSLEMDRFNDYRRGLADLLIIPAVCIVQVKQQKQT